MRRTQSEQVPTSKNKMCLVRVKRMSFPASRKVATIPALINRPGNAWNRILSLAASARGTTPKPTVTGLFANILGAAFCRHGPECDLRSARDVGLL